MIDKLKAYGAIIAAAILGVLLVAQTVRLHNAQLELANNKTQTAKTLQHIADLTSKAYKAVIAERKQWDDEQERNARETATKIEAANADADSARRASERLQKRINALVASARAARTNPGAQPAVAPAEDAAGVLADVLIRADERAGILAAYADALRISNESCVRDYEALRRPGPVESP